MTAKAIGGRSVFNRYLYDNSELVGGPPLSYLTRWRMGIAARFLRESKRPLRLIAQEVGYEAEFHSAKLSGATWDFHRGSIVKTRSYETKQLMLSRWRLLRPI